MPVRKIEIYKLFHGKITSYTQAFDVFHALGAKDIKEKKAV